ncbi:MAG: protein translocase subunit SecF [Anaerolineales bacterium]|nr:MAG: protein translocase subunit SecF [Anaerolineales bacterium]
MFSLVQKRHWYFRISAILILPGIVAMIYSTISLGSPFRLSVDFTGGSMWELSFSQPASPDRVRSLLADAGFGDATVQAVGNERNLSIRTRQMEMATKQALQEAFAQEFGETTELRFESVGPIIGYETTRSAILAILASSLAILFFIAIAFRKVPNAFRYGVCAITKMLHDVLFLLGVASILGIFAGWEVDSLFLTAVLTVVGFSVQDVIVVFDRIRENIPRRRGEPFETIVNRSLLETIHRSLATQLNAIFVMVAIILYGGATIKQFMLTMLIGMVTGTYSSIFFAVPLLVVWEKGEIGHLFRRLRGRRSAA